jgi:hypothetical protein
MPKSSSFVLHRAIKRSENLLYRLAGLPITIAALFTASEGVAATIRRAYARQYWSPGDWVDVLEIGLAICI